MRASVRQELRCEDSHGPTLITMQLCANAFYIQSPRLQNAVLICLTERLHLHCAFMLLSYGEGA